MRAHGKTERRQGQKRKGQLQVHCTNVGRQAQSGECLFLVSPPQLSPGVILLQLSSSRVLVGHQTVHVVSTESRMTASDPAELPVGSDIRCRLDNKFSFMFSENLEML